VKAAVRGLNAGAEVLRKEREDRGTSGCELARGRSLSEEAHSGRDAEEISRPPDDLVRALAELASAEGRPNAARGHVGAEPGVPMASKMHSGVPFDQAGARC
jgi:hypothetical protein